MSRLYKFKWMFVLEFILATAGCFVFSGTGNCSAFIGGVVFGTLNVIMLILLFSRLLGPGKAGVIMAAIGISLKLVFLAAIFIALSSYIKRAFWPFFTGFFSIYAALLIFSIAHAVRNRKDYLEISEQKLRGPS